MIPSKKQLSQGSLQCLPMTLAAVLQEGVIGKPDEQWLRNQISAYFESEHELTLDGETKVFCLLACTGLLANKQWRESQPGSGTQ